jgi:alpha-tubulin suppressor-like RCC1 family protein
MALNYRRTDSTYSITLYDTPNELWEHSMPVRTGEVTKYAQLDSDTGHTNASHMRVRTNGTTYAVLHTETEPSIPTLWVWGEGEYGCLGNGSTANISSPVQVGTDEWIDVSSCTDFGESPFTILIKSDHTLWGTGYDWYGELGNNGSFMEMYSSPVQISSNSDWTKIKCGGNFTLGLRSGGSLWAWGHNDHGQLGQNNLTWRSSPVQIGGTWIDIAAGGNSCGFGIKSNGTLWAWGYNLSGVLGQGDIVDRSSPVQVGSATNWTSVEAGFHTIYVINSSNQLWTCGGGTSGQTAQGDNINRSTLIRIGSLSDWSKVSSGRIHTLAIKTGGSLWGWGTNGYYQLGLGTTTYYSSPVQIGTDTDWESIACSQYSSIAKKTTGALYGWGRNNEGQLGQGDRGTDTVPTQIGSDTNWGTLFKGSTYSTFVIKA